MRSPRSRRTTVLVTLILLMVGTWSGWRVTAGRRPDPVQPAAIARQVAASQHLPDGAAVVDFTELAQREAQDALMAGPQPFIGVAAPNGEIEEPPVAAGTVMAQGVRDDVPQPKVPSPNPTLSFQGLDDIAPFVIPPDTDGAVGPSHVFTTLNNNYRMSMRSTSGHFPPTAARQDSSTPPRSAAPGPTSARCSGANSPAPAITFP